MTPRRKRSGSGNANDSESIRATLANKAHHPPRRGTLAVTSYAEDSTSDTSDFNVNDEDDENIPVRSSRSTRFGRGSKKSSRTSVYSEEEYSDDEKNNSNTNNNNANINTHEPSKRNIHTRSSYKSPAEYKPSENGPDDDLEEENEELNVIELEDAEDSLLSNSKRRRSVSSIASNAVVNGTRKRLRIVQDNAEDEDDENSHPDGLNDTDQLTTDTAPDSQAIGVYDETLNDIHTGNSDNEQTLSTQSLTVKLKIGTLSAQSLSTKETVKTHSSSKFVCFKV